jgi:succinyl-CoA synthetase alpha subunit
MNWILDQQILIQGIDQAKALPYIQAMQSTDTKIVAGIVSEYEDFDSLDIPLFDLVTEAIAEFPQINTTIIFNPPYSVLDAGLEAIAAGIKQIIINSSNIPSLDLCKLFQEAHQQNVQILGPNYGGILVPEKLCLGVINHDLYQAGYLGIINYGDSCLSAELALSLQSHNLGESIIINLGNSSLNQVDLNIWLSLLEQDEATAKIVIIFSDYFNLDQENIAKTLANFKQKEVIIYFLDHHNFRSLIHNRKTKIISDQIPFFQNRIFSFDSFKRRIEKTAVKIVYSFVEISKLASNI